MPVNPDLSPPPRAMSDFVDADHLREVLSKRSQELDGMRAECSTYRDRAFAAEERAAILQKTLDDITRAALDLLATARTCGPDAQGYKPPWD